MSHLIKKIKFKIKFMILSVWGKLVVGGEHMGGEKYLQLHQLSNPNHGLNVLSRGHLGK